MKASSTPRITKWLLALQEFEFTFLREDMRAQLADLRTYREPKEPVSSLQEKIVPHVGIQEEMPEREVTLFFDGSYRRASKEGRIGFVIYDVERKSFQPRKDSRMGECIHQHVKHSVPLLSQVWTL